MSTQAIDALSPLDGRYAGKLGDVRALFSEAGLMRERSRVECAWILALSAGPAQRQLARLPASCRDWLAAIARNPGATEVAAIKLIELRTNHDVKAVEIWIRAELQARGAARADLEWVHFGCTSEDVNNLAYALMLQAARSRILLPLIDAIGATLDALAERHADAGMLGRTHGQAATPTTMGKEMANFAARLESQRNGIERIEVLGKVNGAVGNYNAHFAAMPDVDWRRFTREFVESLGLHANTHTTQIEPHDWIAEYCHAVMRANTVLLDLAKDMWGYVALGYFRQHLASGEVGSSTMPHKVNPIDFENAEGNLGIANALLGHFAEKLPISRWQRDLSDSTVLRNFGVAVGHSVLAYTSLSAGLAKVELDEEKIRDELQRAWEVLGEAVQTVMRAHGIPDAYDKLKTFTRGRAVDRSAMREFIGSLELPPIEKARLLELEPAGYLGLAPLLARRRP